MEEESKIWQGKCQNYFSNWCFGAYFSKIFSVEHPFSTQVLPKLNNFLVPLTLLIFFLKKTHPPAMLTSPLYDFSWQSLLIHLQKLEYLIVSSRLHIPIFFLSTRPQPNLQMRRMILKKYRKLPKNHPKNWTIFSTLESNDWMVYFLYIEDFKMACRNLFRMRPIKQHFWSYWFKISNKPFIISSLKISRIFF